MLITVDQKIGLLRIIIHLIIFVSFTLILNEWALGLAVSVFSRCYINKLAKNMYYYVHKIISKKS